MESKVEGKNDNGPYSRKNRVNVIALPAVFLVLFSAGTVYGFSAEFGAPCAGLAAGNYHTCTLTAEGNVYCYGNNNLGQAEDYYFGDAIGVSTGAYHTCILTSEGNVYCYGNNNYGQAEDYIGGDAVGISAGTNHTCVLKNNGNVECYGYDRYGQAADYILGDAIGVSSGGLHTCVLQEGGNVDCYGYNGDGRAEDYFLGDAIGVSAGGRHTCVLQENGNVDCYGYDNFGQAVDYSAGDATGVSTGTYHTCVLQQNGNVDCYGYGNYGQAGDYIDGGALGVATGYRHTCILVEDGYLNCFGDNSDGQAENYYVGDAVCVLESTTTPNQPPVFDPIEPITVLEYDIVSFVLNATDPDGDSFQYSVDSLPLGSEFDAITGTFSWIPIYDQAGTYMVIFSATDDGTPSETGELIVTISVNDIPPSELVDKIVDMINNEMNLAKKVVQPYLANLKKINDFTATGKVISAINQLNAFVKKIKIDVEKGRLSAEDGMMLYAMANDVISKLEAITQPKGKAKK